MKKVVQSFIHAEQVPAEQLGKRRTLPLNGISVSAQQMWDAVKEKATGKVRFAPDPATQSIMDGAPKRTSSKRAAGLGFSHSKDIAEIVREYEEAALAV